MPPTESLTVTRMRLEQRNEDLRIRAESALEGEKLVCWARLVVVVMLATVMPIGVAIAHHFPGMFDVPQRPPAGPRWESGVLSAAYVGFTILIYFRLRKENPEVRAAMFGPLVFTAIDFGVQALFALIHRADVIRAPPFIPTAILALLIAFSIGRVSVWHVVASTGAAIATLWLIAFLDHWPMRLTLLFVTVLYVVEGLLIARHNARALGQFVEVRRRENLAHFLPRQIVDRVLRSGGTALHPVQREVTILFSDVRDFTTMSERMQPREVLEFLDELMGNLSQIVKGHEGMVNKFIGDGMLALWGVPDASEDHAVAAVKAALDMQRKVAEMNDHRATEGKPPFRLGVGVHTGTVAAGMLGGADQHEYTVIGDAVNLAARIEGLTKTLKCYVLASDRTWELAQHAFEGECAGPQHVKGREESVVVWSVLKPRARSAVEPRAQATG